MTKQRHPRTGRYGRAVLLVWLAAVACVNFVPRHGWSPSNGPVIPHDTFPADCSLCHDIRNGNWHELHPDFDYDHEGETGVALTGAHAQASCLMCHNDRGPVAVFARRGCGGCHQDPHLTRLGSNCQDCHDERTWRPREAIAMHDSTRFPLVGAHAATACFRCHPGAQVGNFAGAPAECRECHATDYASTNDPDHAAVGFSQDCESCHQPIAWRPARFDHPTSFPLAQGHFALACDACHSTANVFTGLTTDCGGCHTDDHTAVRDPNHLAAGFGFDCEQYHDRSSWTRAEWSHPSGFELTLGHAGRDCGSCHVGQSYVNTSEDCASCHLADFQATTEPNHVLSGFGTDCESCHNTAIWQGAEFEHPATFPLEHGHVRACADCHRIGVYTGLSTTCSACHLETYQATTTPNHLASGFGTDCEMCHTTVMWTGATIDHPATFPLTNSHNRACTACHQPEVYTGLDPACIACHNQEYQATSSPPHVAFQLSRACEQCHTTTTWNNASGFQHQFPIFGGDHGGMSCLQCHDNPSNRTQFTCTNCHEHNQGEMADEHDDVPNYQWLTSACYACHPTGQK